MANRSAERLLQIDQAITEELARIDEVQSLILENEGEHAKVVDIHSNQEAQRTLLQGHVRAAQIVYDLAVGGPIESEKYAELVSCQEQLRLLETSIAHNYEVSQSYSADYQDAANRLTFDLKVAQSEVARLQEQREEILKIRTDTFQRLGEETRDLLLAEVQELRLKEDRLAKLLARAREARIAKQESITTRLAAWPTLSRETQEEHGHYELSLGTALLEEWDGMVTKIEENAALLAYDDVLPVLELFLDMRSIPVQPLKVYGKTDAFSTKVWSEKPAPIHLFTEFKTRLKSTLKRWIDYDKRAATARAMQRAAQTPTL